MALLQPERSHLQADAIAGLTFAVVNVPQAMAHALLAAVNPVMGIYTLMVAAPAKNFEQMRPSIDDTDRAVVALALHGNYRIIVEGVIDPM